MKVIDIDNSKMTLKQLNKKNYVVKEKKLENYIFFI